MISHSATLEIHTPFFVHSWVIAPLQWNLSIFKFSGLDLHSLLAKNLNYSVPPAPQSMVQEIFFLTLLSFNPSVPLSFSPFYLPPERVLSPYSFFPISHLHAHHTHHAVSLQPWKSFFQFSNQFHEYYKWSDLSIQLCLKDEESPESLYFSAILTPWGGFSQVRKPRYKGQVPCPRSKKVVNAVIHTQVFNHYSLLSHDQWIIVTLEGTEQMERR